MLKRTETMEPRKPAQNLTETINSLLGLKSHLTSGWVKSVCDIIRNLRSERPSIDLKSTIQRKSDSCGKKADDLDSEISKIKDELAALTANINQLNIHRRKVLNDFLDLKGNIRVFCRIRPIGVGESFGHFRPVVPLESSKVLLRISDNKSKSYSFDKVFQPGSSQDEVFSEVEPVIKSALDGYNACIFAYGQTGTGKTFTMEGTSDFPGVVPRALEALFKQAADNNHAFLFTFSMLEIYMGNLKDLLITQPRKVTDSMPPCLSIQTDSKGGIEIENLVAIQVSEFNQALRLYRLGCQSRSTASTDSNTKSSRSHSLIRLSITCFNAPERQRETNKVWLVDLGGSERVLKTKAWGRRFEEGKAINLSLSALGDVINALQRKKFHVPYRNSKLTRVLKDSLGEGSKVLMLVHVSPKDEDLCETICSLNFATRARSIDMGTMDSTDKRNEKEVVMTNLQQKIKMIEEDRRNIKRKIQILNEKLEIIMRTGPSSSQQLDAPHLSTQLLQPDLDILRNNTRDVTAGNMSKLPRFMMPTICSRRKAGVAHKNSEEKHSFSARRRRSASHRAESVTFPIKGNSDYSSECSISRSSCLLGLNMKGSADIEAEYSQDTSECDIKAVVFTEQEKLPRCSLNQNDHLGHSEGYGNSLQNNCSTTEFMKVDKWLHLHKNEQYLSGYSHRSKPILPIPASEKKYGSNGQKKDHWSRDGKLGNSNFEMNEIFNHEKLEKQVDANGIRRSIQEETIDKPQTLMEDCHRKNPRSGSNYKFHMIDHDLLEKKTDLLHCPLVVDDECGNSFSTSNCGCSFHSGHYDNSINLMSIVQAVKGGTRYPDSFLPENIGCSHILPSDSHYSVVDTKADSNISFSLVAVESKCPMPAEIGMEYSKKENFRNSFRSSMKETRPVPQKLESQIALYMINPDPEELTMPCAKSQEYAETTGICHLLKQKIQIVYASVLIGLGFQDLGFKHEFFYGLML